MSYFQNKTLRIALQLSVAVFIVTGAAWLGARIEENEAIRGAVNRYGYAGVFVVSVASGFNFIAPFPAVSFLPAFLAAGLDLWLVLGLMTLGMTIADSIAYLVGSVGRSVLYASMEARIVQRLEAAKERGGWRPFALLFLFAAIIPLPNELILVPMGFFGYRLRTLVPILFTGNAVFNALTGFGILNIPFLFA